MVIPEIKFLLPEYLLSKPLNAVAVNPIVNGADKF
jgi:hypothetical protein